MADIKFTPSQSKAIKHSGANLLVAAAAGSGKTAVVARRAVRLLTEEKVPANRLLLITFTKAAAAEMRERVADVLKSEIKKNNDAFLRRQLRALTDADICTIDSYLTKLLRRHYHAVDLDPAFSVLSEDEKQNISQKALKKIIEREFEENIPDFIFLCDTLASGKTSALNDIVLKAYDYARKYPDYLEFISSWEKSYMMDEDELKSSEWMEESIRSLKFKLSSAQADIETALRYSLMPDGPSNYAEILQTEFESIKKACEKSEIDDIKESVFAVDFARLPRKDKDCEEAYADMAKKLRDSAKNEIKALQNSLIFMPLDDVAQRNHKMHPAISALSRLVLEYDKQFFAAKRRYNLLDFADLMHFSLKALENEKARDEERERYDYIFVDEYQDTNRLQEKLISHITKGDNLFCVGDVKQSIYSFRQAEPSLFIDRMDKSSPLLEGENHLIPLSENFRSSKPVVDFINFVFTDVMTRKTGGVDYEGYELLKCKAKRPEGEYENAKAELLIIDTQQKDKDSTLTNIEYEAILAADKIKEVMSQKIYDGKLGIFRPAKYSDICILSRSFKPIVRPVRRILEQCGIPVTPVGESGYLDMIEIEIAVNILKIIDNQHRDVALISAMNSPAFGFSMEELIAIRKNFSKKNTPFYLAAENYIKQQKDNLSDKLAAFFEKIRNFRLLSKHMSVGEFIWHMLTDTMLYDAVGSLPGGRVRQQNLRILAERGDAFSMKPGRNLSLFLEHLNSVSQSNTDFESAGSETNEDSVKFMSIHKSKGLEFPVVILMNTASGTLNNTDSIIMSGGLPPGVKCYDPEEMTKKTTIAYDAASDVNKFTDNSESLRILYVAMTRARERLIMIGSVSRSLDAKIQSWMLPKRGELLFDKSFLDILGASTVRISGNGISDEMNETDISGVYSKIISAALLKHDKKKRKNAVLDAIKEAAKTTYSEDIYAESYEKQQYIPAKTTATALLSGTPEQYAMEDFSDVPDFMRDDVSYTAADRGTFTHTVMQFIDFNADISGIGKTINDLISRNILPEDSKSEIDIDSIERFLKSDICKRIRKSSNIKKETPFVVKIPANEAYSDISSNKDLLVQGIIDLCFIEDNKWVLVDYKTNRITNDNTPGDVVSHYKNQLKIYKRALEDLTGIDVKETGLYLLSQKEDDAYHTL